MIGVLVGIWGRIINGAVVGPPQANSHITTEASGALLLENGNNLVSE